MSARWRSMVHASGLFMEVVLLPHRSFQLPYAALLCGTVALRRNHGKSSKDIKLARKSWRIGQNKEAKTEEQEAGEARSNR
jgi:hypothetical protein